MKRLFSSKTLIATAIALGALGAASLAQARDEARYPIAVGEPHSQPHRTPPIYNHDRGGPFADSDRDGIPNRFDRDSRYFDARATRHHPMWGDYDRDGVPNKFDRFPHNPRRS